MNLLESKALQKFSTDLTDLLKRCSTRDQIVAHFSHYLAGQVVQAYIEDYDFFPEITQTETLVKVHVCFPWNLGFQHEFIIRKADSPNAAYDRAMGVI